MSIYNIAVFVVITVFYGSYLVKGVMLRRRGIESARLAKGDKSKEVLRQEVMLSVMTILMAAVQYFTLFTNNRFLSFGMERMYLQLAGVVVASVGVLYFIAAIVVMRDSWRAGIDYSQNTKLITSGIYRFSRNPAFVGFDLLYVGFAMVFPSVLTILLTVFSVILFHRQILKEEIYLRDRFGVEYDDYNSGTYRY